MKSPKLTIDIIINLEGKIILIKRKNPPYGWALPGGFVDYGETVGYSPAGTVDIEVDGFA